MTTVLPIKGLRFNQAAGINLAEVITPPYDVITGDMQNIYYEKSPYNVIRLEYAKSFPGDNDQENKYTRAAAIFQDWLARGILVRETKPAFYLYEQHFGVDENKYIRKGFYCGVGLSPFAAGQVVPHEETLDNPKADRLALLRQCETNFSPIFGLYKDKNKFLDDEMETFKAKQQPAIAFTDEDGQLHKVWVVTDEHLCKTIKGFFADKKIYIADGHHRYETALQFYQEKKASGQNSDKYAQVLMSLVNIYDAGLLAFPTHRVITESRIGTAPLLEKLANRFLIKELPPAGDRETLLSLLNSFLTGATKDNLSLGLYTPEQKLFMLTVKNQKETDRPDPWLDTVVLQDFVLADIFGLNEAERKNESGLCYLRDEWAAKQQVDQGRARYIFFLNRPPVEEIISLAEKGIRLPQKSTYFFPKFVTGLITLQLGEKE